VETRFDPQTFEPKWQREWAARGWFKADAASSRRPFCIMIPPPNVTGKLHMGHALQSTLQDLLTRWRRMQGFEALWLPGTDHAGIATQLMVERQLAKEGTNRQELGRQRFLDRMWEWKATYGDNIRRQLERMGASCDFGRERFTLDEGLSRAVRVAFVRLHQAGRIYRGEYIVTGRRPSIPRSRTSRSRCVGRDVSSIDGSTSGWWWPPPARDHARRHRVAPTEDGC
jgi:valyl-tRNA synthetase